MKCFLIFILLAFGVALGAQTAIPPDQGSGTLEDPLQIASFGNLIWLSQSPDFWSVHYIQTVDIDCSESVNQDSGAGWIPIGSFSTQFTGSYDGQGYQIQELYFSRSTRDHAGFFGYAIGAKINRVHLRDISFWGRNFTGGLIGAAGNNTVVNNCSVTGSVRGNVNVGGFVGHSDQSIYTNCYSHASVRGNEQVGGFVGLNGWNIPSHLYRCYSTGLVTLDSGTYGGGLVGRHQSGEVKYCYWDTQSSGMATDPIASPKTTAEMKQQASYELWNFSTQWSITENVSYPDLDGLSSYALPAALTLSDLAGSGTAADPYVITNAAELNVMRQDLEAHYVLTVDIDLSASVVWDFGRGWEPVGTITERFNGHFDGDGHSITSLVIHRPQTDYQGLFGLAENATIRRLNLQNCDLMGKNHIAPLAAHIHFGSVDEITTQGTVTGSNYLGGVVSMIDAGSLQRSTANTMICGNNWLGGIVGVISSASSGNGIVSNSVSHGSIVGGSTIGGIVGQIGWGYVQNCHSHASVSGSSNLGGLAGLVGWSQPGYVTRCFSTGTVLPSPGAQGVGGFVGHVANGGIVECYWDTQSSGYGTDGYATGKTTAEMKQQATYERWNFDALWQIDEGVSYPFHQDLALYALPQNISPADLLGLGTEADPYLVHTPDELNVLRQALGAFYRLENDIDLSATCVWNGGLGWEPVGTAAAPFTGLFDGAGHNLSKLSFCRPMQDQLGLFGTAMNAQIGDLRLPQLNVYANNNVGGVCGTAISCAMGDIRVQGTVSGYGYLGGIFGWQQGGVLHRAYANVDIFGRGSSLGGVAGKADTDAQLAECASTGSVHGYILIGGLVGELAHGTLSDSYSRAAVHAVSYVGGAVGRTGWSEAGNLVHCYSTGSVTMDPGGYWAGGLAGQNSYGSYTYCFWDITTSGQTSSAGMPGVQGLSTEFMIYPGSVATFNGWDFSSTWYHDVQGLQNGGYPYLAWLDAPVPDPVQGLVITVSGDQVQLQWQPVAGVSLYHIYASEDPYAPWHQWSYLGQSAGTTSNATGGNRRFYIVRSVR